MQDENTLREVAKDCVHCGFCLPACPTYQLWACLLYTSPSPRD